MSESTEATLEVRDLWAHYGPVAALRGVSMRAQRGQITAVLGANGAGKTTLLRTVSGLVRSSAGQVLLDGKELTGLPAESIARAGLTHVPEGRGVIAELTVEQNLRLGDLLGSEVGAPRHPMREIYELFPALADRRGRQASTLSGGERQMLVIGRALLSAPTVLLLDEPSLGLAPKIVTQLFTLLRELTDQRGLAVVLVEQNAHSALRIADDGFVLGLGAEVAVDAAALATDERLRHAYLGF